MEPQSVNPESSTKEVAKEDAPPKTISTSKFTITFLNANQVPQDVITEAQTKVLYVDEYRFWWRVEL